MDELEMLLTEARSLASDMLATIEQAQEADSTDDVKYAIQNIMSSGDEMRERVEEALDFVSTEDEESSIDASLVHVEDALDSCQVALTSDDPSVFLDEIRVRTEAAVFDLAPMEEIEVE